jgi:hypothetical protein
VLLAAGSYDADRVVLGDCLERFISSVLVAGVQLCVGLQLVFADLQRTHFGQMRGKVSTTWAILIARPKSLSSPGRNRFARRTNIQWLFLCITALSY